MAEYEKLSLIDKIKEFYKIEEEIKTLIDKPEKSAINSDDFINKFIHLACNAFEVKNLIELELARDDISNLQIDNRYIKNTLNDIIRNKKFTSINAYKVLQQMRDKEKFEDSNQLIIDELEFSLLNFDELFQDFHTWFDVGDYYYRKLSIGPIITSNSIPEKLVDYFKEVRDAYSYGLEKSCVSLCRALLELCLLDKLTEIDDYTKKVQELKRSEGQKKEFSLSENIYFAKKYMLIDGELKGKAHKIRLKAINILHVKSKNFNLEKITTFDIVKYTVKIVEHLYY